MHAHDHFWEAHEALLDGCEVHEYALEALLVCEIIYLVLWQSMEANIGL